MCIVGRAGPRSARLDRMLRIGAHMSVAGGISKAVDRAAAHGCEALQIFTKNGNRWLGKPLDPGDVKRFRARLEETAIRPAVSHASYLINLATTFDALRRQSIDAFIDELDRADALGLLGVVVHPGTCTAGSEEEGLRLIAAAIGEALAARAGSQAMVLLEHTAGQGRTLGYRFEHLAAIIDHLDGSPRVGRVPRHLSPGRVRLRHRHRIRLLRDVRRLRSPGRARPAQGLSRQRLQEAVREPCRSARAHRPRLPRRGAVPPPAARSALQRTGAADRDREVAGVLTSQEPSSSIRSTSRISTRSGGCGRARSRVR